MRELSWALQAELLGRLLLSVLLGSVLGWERQMGQHPAGLRTHMLVALGATAYTIAGTYGVAGLGTVQDPGRVAAQIVTGIGFIGAGTIWRSSSEQGIIRGLTTAASIWVAASIGMLAGFGLYVLAIGSALLGLVVLRFLKGLERAPIAFGRAVARRLPRRRVTGRVEPPYAVPAAPAPADGTTTWSSVPGIPTTPAPITPPAEADQEALERPPKRKRLRKKERKKKRSKTTVDHSDQISDAPDSNR
ncbi:MAG: MgtC/SapB family protein [Chloroflexi bacterium]|nr:MgtC/SapB family protein [Chloroflexota bacterium]